MANATDHARLTLHKAIKKSLKRGECLSFDTLLEICKEAESEEGISTSH